MKIKTILVSGYRQIKEAKINMEKNITIIAGANNSGKTSLVELFNYVFSSSHGKFNVDDLSVDKCQKWSSDVFPYMQAIFNSGETKEKVIDQIMNFLFPVDDNVKARLIEPVQVKIQIDYDKDNDDIRNFADYIMDFDPDKNSFYFIYEYAVDPEIFKKNLADEYDKYNTRFKNLSDKGDEEVQNGSRIIKEMLIDLYGNSSVEAAYFADEMYENKVKMEVSSFKKLFNYCNIMANRYLDDESSDGTHLISKNMMEIARSEENWNDLIAKLPDEILRPIEEAGIQEKIRSTSLDTLSETIKSISKTDGGHTGSIMLDMVVTESAIDSLLRRITSAKYLLDECYLKESAQGLGFSNLIYIHLQLEKYKKSINPLIVNLFVIEEPEVHMHPQMQNVFTKYLFDYYDEQNNMQGLITTHSSQVVRAAEMKQIRVLRHSAKFESKLYDFHEFFNEISGKKELIEFYNWFYTINFSDIIFADKIIMYEGDTERMLIKNLLDLDEFESLRGQYLSFVQVGGAYAYNYRPLVEFLGVKTVIITDLDYDKDASSSDQILASETTNSTINNFYKISFPDESKPPTVKDLYDWQTSANIVLNEGQIYLAFQNQEDGYARTLEEAMLSKHYNINSYETKSRDEWKELRENDKLKYTIPRNETCNIRDIVLHTSNNKTDFMYSVILNNLAESMLPAYIKKALIWLAK
ncbi:MAG TPA: AAA family ATPase [Syntrophomonadaceae bacterium]|nr:AAA family ATPase [Syntrophomonadaceae bacterium]